MSQWALVGNLDYQTRWALKLCSFQGHQRLISSALLYASVMPPLRLALVCQCSIQWLQQLSLGYTGSIAGWLVCKR